MLVAALTLAALGSLGSGTGIAIAPATRTTTDGGVVTLYRYDDLRRTFAFTTGAYGQIVQDGEIRNRCSEVSIWGGANQPDEIAFGLQGGDAAAVARLGDIRDAATKGTSYYQLDRARAEKELAGVAAEGVANFRVTLGHVYLVRLERAAAKKRVWYFRVRVIDHAPGRRVTLRWDRL